MNLDQLHPTYERRLPQWRFNLHHYFGGRALVDAVTSGEDASVGDRSLPPYLIKFELEGQTGFESRLRRSAGLYDNMVRRAIELYQAHLFRVEPKRVLPPALQEVLEDVDLTRTKASKFFERVGEFGTLIPLPGDPGYAQHTRRAHNAGVITDEERRYRCQLEWAVVRSRGVDDVRDCVDGAGHDFMPNHHWTDRHGRQWTGADCSRCAVFTVVLVDTPADSTRAFLDLLAENAEHREEAA